MSKATVAVQGFGNVGSETAIALGRYGAKVIAISDYTGAIYNPKGINLQKALSGSQSASEALQSASDQVTEIVKKRTG